MADHSRAEHLRRLLRAELAAHLAPEGWRELGTGTSAGWGRLAVFGRPLNADFMITVELHRAGSWPDRPPVVVTHVTGGVSYEPLRRLYPLLGDFQYAVLHGGFDPEEDDEDEDEDEELFEVRGEADVPAVAEQLAGLVRQRAHAFGEDIGSVDALLRALGDRDGGYLGVERAAVLAAAGRYDEAAAVLDRVAPRSDAGGRPFQSRTARQLRRWIEARGDPALIPSEPPPDPHPPADRRSIGELWRHARARDEAVKRVRASAGGRDRAELRAMLEREFAQRGLHESRIRIEATLDHLHDSPAEQLQTTMSLLARIGRGVARMVQEKRVPDLQPPDWLDPPARAAYELPRSGRWIDVALAEDAVTWLDEVQAQIPAVFGVSTVRAWLAWEPGPREEGSVLAVHLGEHRVGTISPADASAFIPVMDAAAFRDELPALPASLARRTAEPRYVIEVAAPASRR